MTSDAKDPNRPLFANMDDDEGELEGTSGTGPDRTTPGQTDAMAINPAGSGAIPLGAPADPDRGATTRPQPDDTDPRGH